MTLRASRTMTRLLLLSLLAAVYASEPLKLRVHVSTWNVNEKKPTMPLTLLTGVDRANPPDVIVVGLQELTMQPQWAILHAIVDKDAWTLTMDALLKSRGYSRIDRVALVGIVMNVYALEKHLDHITGSKSSYVRTGLHGFYGNKGGVIIRMNLYDTTVCLVNVHFDAHDDKQEDRINTYRQIDNKRHKVCDPSSDTYTFWMGDMNFRLEDASLSAQRIENMVNQGQLEKLLLADQLTIAKQAGQIFHDFLEPPITFRPTYKYLVGSDNYSLKRRPAWTDRILYSLGSRGDLEVLEYSDLSFYSTSDHKPVHGLYNIAVEWPGDPFWRDSNDTTESCGGDLCPEQEGLGVLVAKDLRNDAVTSRTSFTVPLLILLLYTSSFG